MPKFKKKPVVIEAFRFRREVAPEWFSEAINQGVVQPNLQDGTATIKTLEGDHLARTGDYVIKGVKGELYPCRADIFEATYERVLE